MSSYIILSSMAQVTWNFIICSKIANWILKRHIYIYIYIYVVIQAASRGQLFETLGRQHTRPLCLSPSPGVCPSSCLLHWRCHPTTSPCDASLSFCPQSFPASGTFPMSHMYASDDQNTGHIHSIYTDIK